MKLEPLQRAFFARIAQVGEADPQIEAEVRSFGALSASDRLDLYASMYFLRLLEALRADFPLVAKLVGDEAFELQAADYLRAHPSTKPSLAELGRHFEDHLRRAIREGQSLRADAADLAALEWARAEVFTEADAVPAEKDAFARLGPERFGEARLTLIPALRVLTLAHDGGALWNALDADQPAPAVAANPSALVVWRRGFEVFHAPIPAEEGEALRLARESHPVEALCAAFESSPEPALAAFNALASWLAEGMVERVDG